MQWKCVRLVIIVLSVEKNDAKNQINNCYSICKTLYTTHTTNQYFHDERVNVTLIN